MLTLMATFNGIDIMTLVIIKTKQLRLRVKQANPTSLSKQHIRLKKIF